MPSARLADTQGHDATKTLESLMDHLARHDKPIAFLFGAGTSSAVRCAPEAAEDQGSPLIPSVRELTTLAKNDAYRCGEIYQSAWDAIERRCQEDGKEPNIENILTRLQMMKNAVGSVDTLLGLTKSEIQALDDSVRKTIATAVSPPISTIPSDLPHYRLARWLGRVTRQFPVEIFTVNYDILLEYALEVENIPLFDGFIGGYEPFFFADSLRRQGVAPGSSWTRLWKLHGSITWKKIKARGRSRIVRTQVNTTGEMIYPTDRKYDESRQQPYSALMDRLNRFLDQDDSLLIVSGFNFGDEHINNLIFSALENRSRTHVFALQFADLDDHHDLVIHAKTLPNLVVICPTFGVIGTDKSYWKMAQSTIDHLGNIDLIRSERSDADGGSAPSEKKSLTIGDFNKLCEFLETMISR